MRVDDKKKNKYQSATSQNRWYLIRFVCWSQLQQIIWLLKMLHIIAFRSTVGVLSAPKNHFRMHRNLFFYYANNHFNVFCTFFPLPFTYIQNAHTSWSISLLQSVALPLTLSLAFAIALHFSLVVCCRSLFVSHYSKQEFHADTTIFSCLLLFILEISFAVLFVCLFVFPLLTLGSLVFAIIFSYMLRVQQHLQLLYATKA